MQRWCEAISDLKQLAFILRKLSFAWAGHYFYKCRKCAWMIRRGFCCQSRSSLWPHSGGRTQYLRNTEYSPFLFLFFFIFFPTCGTKLSWAEGWLGRWWEERAGGHRGFASIPSHSGWRKDVPVEAWTQALRTSAIVRSAGTGVFVHTPLEEPH